MYEAAISVVPSLLWTPHSYQVCTTSLVLFMQGYCATISCYSALGPVQGTGHVPYVVVPSEPGFLGGQPCHDQDHWKNHLLTNSIRLIRMS